MGQRHANITRSTAGPGRGRLAGRAGLVLALAWSVLCAVPVAGADEAATAAHGSDRSDRGFYLGLGVTRQRIDLTFDERATIQGSGIAMESWVTGSELVLGYGFGPRFRLELSAFGAEPAATPEGAQVRIGIANLTALAPIGGQGAWHPHLLAGLGLAGMPVSAPGFPERAYLMTNGHCGAGLRVDLGRRFFLQGDYTLYGARHRAGIPGCRRRQRLDLRRRRRAFAIGPDLAQLEVLNIHGRGGVMFAILLLVITLQQG